MKISFSAAACSTLEFPAAASLAVRLGFDGVELRVPEGSDASIRPFTDQIQSAFTLAGISVSSLDIGIAGSKLADRISLAMELNCRAVRLKCPALFASDPLLVSEAIADILKCADRAASSQVLLMIENQPVAGSALAMWHVLDRIDYPSVACCWNTLSAALAGDSPFVAVPTLNHRIQSVLLCDGTVTSHPRGLPLKRRIEKQTSSMMELGTGNVPARKTLDRLRNRLSKQRHSLSAAGPER